MDFKNMSSMVGDGKNKTKLNSLLGKIQVQNLVGWLS